MNLLRLSLAFVLVAGCVLLFRAHLGRVTTKSVRCTWSRLAWFAVPLFCGVLLGISVDLVDSSLGYQTVHYGALLALTLIAVGATALAWTAGGLGLRSGLFLYLLGNLGVWLGCWAGVQSFYEIAWWDDLYWMDSFLWLVSSVLGAGIVTARVWGRRAAT